jgi:hypothetical protein
MTKSKFIVALLGYAILLYIAVLLPIHLYEPRRNFNLPDILWFIHLIILYIHEAGHLFFSIFGKTMNILGGSLMQVLVPLAWFFVAKREKSKLSNVALFFTSVSIVDVSIYVKDAGMLQLPLIGGLSKSHHDWANLLNDWGMIEWGYAMGEMMFWIGMGIAAYGLFSGIKQSVDAYKTTSNSTTAI